MLSLLRSLSQKNNIKLNILKKSYGIKAQGYTYELFHSDLSGQPPPIAEPIAISFVVCRCRNWSNNHVSCSGSVSLAKINSCFGHNHVDLNGPVTPLGKGWWRAVNLVSGHKTPQTSRPHLDAPEVVGFGREVWRKKKI
jgi:hypothetical protein